MTNHGFTVDANDAVAEALALAVGVAAAAEAGGGDVIPEAVSPTLIVAVVDANDSAADAAVFAHCRYTDSSAVRVENAGIGPHTKECVAQS